MGYRGKSKGSYGSLKHARSFQSTRSARARSIDAALKAPFAKTTEQWLKTPNRFDLPNIDDPRTKRQKKTDTLKYRGKIIGRKISEGETVAKAMGTTQVGTGASSTSLSKLYWDKYSYKYPSEKWESDDYEYVWNSKVGELEVKNTKTGQTVYGISSTALPESISRSLKGDVLAKAYAEYRAKERNENYRQYGNFFDARATRGRKGWKVEELLLPHQQFLNDVRAGRIVENGLKLSEMQVKGKPPESGYLQAVSGKESPNEKLGYKTGLVIKITGDEDKRLEGKHNTWAVITDVKDPWHYEVVSEGGHKNFVIRDTDVKAWIGDEKTDFIGIGEERHKKEVIPLIQKTMRGNIPYIHTEMNLPGGFINVARRMAADAADFAKDKRGAKLALAEVKRNKSRYIPKDYSAALKDAQNWADAYDQVAEEIKRYGRDTVVKLGWD